MRTATTVAYYEDNASPYCALTRPLSMATQLARFATGLKEGARVLDVGCGGGRDLAALKTAGFAAVGLDISPRLAAMAEEHSGCRVVVGDLRHPPFKTERFDGIWAAASLLHLRRDEIGPALRGLRRLLVPGGRLFASVKAGSGEEQSHDGRWFTYFQVDEWEDLLADSGFAEIEVEYGLDKAGHDGGRGWIQSFASIV